MNLIVLIDCEFGLRVLSSNVFVENNSKCFEYESCGSHSDIRWINFTNVISLLLENGIRITQQQQQQQWNDWNRILTENVCRSVLKYVWQALIKLGVENLVIFWEVTWGRFWKLAFFFFISKVISMLFLYTCLSKLPSKVKENNMLKLWTESSQ